MENYKSSQDGAKELIPAPKLRSFTLEEFGTYNPEKAHDIWQANHKVILKELTNNSFRFFGLHGTSSENSHNIIRQDVAFLEMATFYDKSFDETFLYQLYHVADYTTSYACKKGMLGKTLVFNLENDKGENTSLKWEHLYPGAPIALPLNSDTETEVAELNKLKELENLLFRTSHKVDTDNLLGQIDFEELEKYISDTESGPDRMWRLIMKRRILMQEIVNRILAMSKK